jgi:fucose 4-O-acetylase-like acetyltransferase
MIGLVVNMHACVTYSHVGSWYRMEQPEPSMAVKLAFFLWQGHLQAFFMGLLFFLAGVFAYRSLQRRGPGAFLLERGRRLGLPSLLYMLLLHPFIVYVLLGNPGLGERPSLPSLYGRYLTSERVLRGNGPMWFALALLLFCTVLAGMRAWKRSPAKEPDRLTGALGNGALLGFALVLVSTTFLARLVQPLGTNVLNFQLGFFAQYVAAFVVGVYAGRPGWLDELAASHRARVAGWAACLAGPLWFVTIVVLGGPPPEEGPNLYAGGWNLRALAYATWEQCVGLGLALGALAWFHRHGNRAGRLATWLSDRAFAVYLLHPVVLVALTPLVRPVAVHPFVAVVVLTLIGLGGSFLAADLAKRLPGLRNIL